MTSLLIIKVDCYPLAPDICLAFIRYIIHAEKQALEFFTSKIYDDLRYGQFDVLRLIKAADSSQTSCFSWQALELLRSLLIKETPKLKQKSFFVSRATVQRAQVALETASEEIVPVSSTEGYVTMDIPKVLEQLLCCLPAIEKRGLSVEEFANPEKRSNAIPTWIGEMKLLLLLLFSHLLNIIFILGASMDGAELTKSKGMVIGGLKLLDPEMNRIIIKELYKLDTIKAEGSEKLFLKPKRESSKMQKSNHQRLEVEEDEAEQRCSMNMTGSSFSFAKPTSRSSSDNNRAIRRKKKVRDGADEQLSFQSVLAILLVCLKIGKDNLDVNFR